MKGRLIFSSRRGGRLADRIGAALRANHRGLQVLRIVDQMEASGDQIRRPFTQTALLEKASQLLAARGAVGAAAASS